MSLRVALEYARNILWSLLVDDAKEEIRLTDDWKARIDQAHTVCESALEEDEEE